MVFECLAVVGVKGLVGHGGFRVAKVLATVHAQAAGASTEAVALGSEFAAVADLAEDITSVVANVGRIESAGTKIMGIF